MSSEALLWSTAQPSSASSDSLWTFPATQLQLSSNNRDRISSIPLPSLPVAAVTCRHKRIRSSDDHSSIRTPERRSYSSSNKRGTCPVVITTRSSQPSATRYNDVAATSSSRPSAGTHLRVSSPSYEKKLQKTFSMTTSYAMRLQSNFRLSKQEEAPVIVFDQNGKMYTNVYPPIGHRSNDYNTRKTGDGDWGRRYLPKWLVIGGKKT